MLTQEVKSLNVRLPGDLHAMLVELADLEDRSLQAQIIRLLRDSATTELEAARARRPDR